MGNSGSGSKANDANDANDDDDDESPRHKNPSVVERRCSLNKNTSICVPKLTAAQITLIRQAWNQTRAKGPSYVGDYVLQSIFEKSEDVRAIFMARVAVHDQTDFKQLYEVHTRKFGAFFEKIIENLEDLYRLDLELLALGKLHLSFKPEGFQAKYWNLFAEALVDCTLGWGMRRQRCEETQKAWVAIVFYVVERLKTGYYAEFRKQRRMSSALKAGSAESGTGASSGSASQQKS